MEGSDDDFHQKFEGFTIPKKKVEEKSEKNEDPTVQEKVEEKKDKEPSQAKSPKKTKKISRQSANDFLKNDSDDESFHGAAGSADPLGLEPVLTYGEAKGTRHTALSTFINQFDGKLPDDLISKCSDASCEICSVNFNSNAMVARSHYAGKTHAKKFKQALEKWQQENPVYNVIPPMKQPEVSSSMSFYENRQDHDETFCHLCNIELSSKIVATSHYQGKNHAKQLRKRQSEGFVPTQPFPPPSVPKKMKFTHVDPPHVIADSASRQGSGNRFFCLGCKLHFKSNDQYAQHLQSQEHKMKANGETADSGEAYEVASMPEFTAVPSNDSIDEMLSKLRSNPKAAFDCSLCQVQCSSQATLMTHLAGKQHQRKLEMASSGNEGQFKCELCNVETTDQNGLDMHLNGKKHQKKAKQLGNM